MDYSVSSLADQLGIDWERVNRWIRHRNLPSTKAGRIRAISQADFIEWASNHKWLVSNIDRTCLLNVIGDRALVDAIKATPHGSYYAWKREEEDWLSESSGTMPVELITKHLNKLNRANGYPLRTVDGVSTRMSEMGLSYRCELDNFSVFGLSEALGINKNTVRLWVKNRGLKARKRNKTYAILREDFKKWAKAHPYLLSHIDRDNLLFLLDCPKLVDRILDFPFRNRVNSKFVRNVDTGDIYPSLTDAAIAVGCDRRTVSDAVIKGHRCKGFHWEYVEMMELTA